MEQNVYLHSNISWTSEPHPYGQRNRAPYEAMPSHSSDAGLNDTAALQAEIDALDRERAMLMMKKEKAAKKAEIDRLRVSESTDLSAGSSINVVPRGSLLATGASSIEAFQRPGNAAHDKTSRYSGSQEQMPPPYSTTSEPMEYQAQQISSSSVQQSVRATHLTKPIAIPATSAKLGSPFMRAYPPYLESYGVSRSNFLGFLDDLNRCAVASPPVQILGLAGNIVSFVPLQTAQIVGTSVNLAANLATYGVSKGRTEVCLRTANRELFAPRGLKAEIAKLDAVAKLAEIPGVLDPVTGKLDKKASILAPIESLEEAQGQSAQHRRLQALESWIAPLDMAPLPEIKQSNNMLGKLHTMASENQRRKEEKKLLKDRDKAFEELGKASREAAKIEKEFEKEMRKLDKEEKKVRKEADSSRKLEKELEKIEKERVKLIKEREKDERKLEEDKRKEDKEEGSLRKILWLIIRNIEDPSGPGPNPDLDSPGSSPPL
ncbi:hypothetical protein N0V93_002635 [Gnomoniopsis smithogilvyi]|uniref:Uncharacterized protein n=1 Tax=Gnomoniopsis smithogilvyi TaxID=1191159 RepID=A0A9W8YZ78_9PEZI|nr:hypothetical protein N0V93_002635 [Gnomoniopsis smithogilvyi]